MRREIMQSMISVRLKRVTVNEVNSNIIFERKSWIAAMNEPCLPKRIYGYCMAAADFHILTCLRGQTCPFREKVPLWQEDIDIHLQRKKRKKGSCLPVWRQRPLLFITAVVMAYLLDDSFGFLVGGVGLFATLLSVYGFIMGLLSFSEEGRSHKTSIIGSISNGLFLIVWIGVYLTGL